MEGEKWNLYNVHLYNKIMVCACVVCVQTHFHVYTTCIQAYSCSTVIVDMFSLNGYWYMYLNMLLLQVIENCPVSKIISEQSSISGTPKITGVLTPYGLIKTNTVVNCSGKWIPYVRHI